jgi:Second Messenger Oligonucleotide or Dinucleotide Synthetase domain
MSVATGFDDLQSAANASNEAVQEARRRRDVFREALGGAADVIEVMPTGSFARGTHKDPIHDVDLVAVYDPGAHPGWGAAGGSAKEALEYTRDLIKECLGSSGTVSEEVRLTRLNHHSVKCFLDDPEDTDPFTVDVTPSYRRPEGGLWIPEQNNEQWVPSDPEYLNGLVAGRHAEWNQFARLVRVLKLWNANHGKVMKSLVVEVLALDLLPVAERPEALSQFFTAAQDAVWSPVCDPAGLCGEIQKDLDRNKAHEVLAEAAELAWRAVDAAGRGETATAMCLWHQVFGDVYPEPTGGCSGSGAAVVGAAAAAVASAKGWSRPKRPIRDAPQG